MKAKTKIILSSCMTIAMAASLIAGSTYAIFTSESKTNIAVNTGKVNVVATADITKAWSAEWKDSGYEDNVDLAPYAGNDGKGYLYTNGGTVFYNQSQNTVNLNNITPGDGAEINIDITNYSSVKTKYRLEVTTANDGGLFNGLEITYEMNGSELNFTEGKDILYTEWATLEIPADPELGEDVGTFTVSIELPVKAGNEYQETSCEIAINVFAVQYNGHVDDVVMHSGLMQNVFDAAEEQGILLEETPAIIFGTYSRYESVVGAYEKGVPVSDDGISARMFYVNDDEDAQMDAIYVLARTGIAAEVEGDETFTFAGTGFTYVDLSGVDFSNTTSLGNMFKNSEIETLKMSGVDLSNATDVESMFSGCTALAKVDFTKANLSSLKDNPTVVGGVEISAMHYLFGDCESLEEVNFSGADLAGLTKLNYAFAPLNSEPANNTLLKVNFANTNLKNVTTMGRMFGACAALKEVTFEKAIASSVEDISQMFVNCAELESVNFSWVEIPNVTNKIASMFANCISLNKIDFSHANLSGFTTFSTVFGFSSVSDGSIAGGKEVNLSYATLTGLTTGKSLFQYNTIVEKVDLSHADLSNVTTMLWAFSNCTALKTVNFDGAQLGSVTNLEQMFSKCTSLESFVGVFNGCDTSNFKSMKQMFDGCSALTTVDFSDMNLSSATDMSTIFRGCTELAIVKFPKDLSNVNTMQDAFNGCKKLKSVDFSWINFDKLSTVSNMFNGANLEKAIFTHANLASVTSLYSMFQLCSTIKEVDFSYADLSGFTSTDYTSAFQSKNSLMSANFSHTIFTNLTTMTGMFSGCTNLTTVDFSNAELPKLTNMYNMFNNCALESFVLAEVFEGIDLSKVTTMGNMFNNCSSLKTVNFAGVELNGLTSSSTSTVYGINGIFAGCSQLTDVNFSGAVLSGITRLTDIFKDCGMLKTVDFSNVKFSSGLTSISVFASSSTVYTPAIESVNFSGATITGVTSTSSLFRNCTELKWVDLSNTNLSAVTDMQYMFYGCSRLVAVDLGAFNPTNTFKASMMFSECTNLEHIYVADSIDLSAKITSGYYSALFQNCTKLPGWPSNSGSLSQQQYMNGMKTTEQGGFLEVGSLKAWLAENSQC